jgi:hypothetical protein
MATIHDTMEEIMSAGLVLVANTTVGERGDDGDEEDLEQTPAVRALGKEGCVWDTLAL